MTDKIQLIKQEIGRLSDEYPMSRGLLKHLNKFIDSIPEEPKCIYNKTLDERKKFCKYCSAACVVRIEEKPVSDDLEEEITKCYKSRNDLMMTRKQFGKLIHRFTNWQHGKDFDDLLQSEMKFPKEYYERGRADMREEMMKDSISCNVAWYDGFILDYTQEQQDDILSKLGANVGDKVKIIIVKTEQ